MLKKTVSGIMLVLLLTTLIFALSVRLVKPAHSTVIYLDPSNYVFNASEVWVGFRFNVTVRVQDVENLSVWQVCVLYNETLINATRCFVPLWDTEYVFYGKSTLWSRFRPLFCFDPGRVVMGDLLWPPPLPSEQEPFYGSGKLAIIEFEILSVPLLVEAYSTVLNITNEFTLLLDSNGIEIPAVKEDGYYEIWTVIANVDINPQSLNLKSRGRWITCYVELPEGYNVSDVDISTIMLDTTISADLSVSIVIGDYDNDAVLDLMVCFNRTVVAEYILSKNVVFGNITLEVSGKLYNGAEFIGTDTVLVSALLGDINVDGTVDLQDIYMAALAFGESPGRPKWNPQADINNDETIDLYDIYLIAKNFGKQA